MLRRRDQFTLDLMEKVPQGAGSGTIWDTDGHVVTNAHVIAGASDLQARPSCHPIHMSSSRRKSVYKPQDQVAAQHRCSVRVGMV